MEKFSIVETNLTFLTSTNPIVISMSLVLTIILSGLCGISMMVEGSYFIPSHITSSVLCPDLQDSNNRKAKYFESHNKSVFQLVKYWKSSDSPCFLESSDADADAQESKALIAGIHIDTKPWNFPNEVNTCTEHITVRLPSDDALYGLCRIAKNSEIFVEFNVSDINPNLFFNFAKRGNSKTYAWFVPQDMTPSLWRLPNSKLGINFPDSSLNYLTGLLSWTKYIQIIFIVHTAGGDCYVQVQQYLIRYKNEMSCEHLHQAYPFRLCGVYACDKIVDILRAVGLREEKIPQVPKTLLPIPTQPKTSTRPSRPKRRESYIKNKEAIIGFLIAALLLITWLFRLFRAFSSPPHHQTSSSGAGGRQIGNCSDNPDNAAVGQPPTPTVVLVVTYHDVIPLVQTGTSTEEEPPPAYDNCQSKLPTYEEATML